MALLKGKQIADSSIVLNKLTGTGVATFSSGAILHYSVDDYTGYNDYTLVNKKYVDTKLTSGNTALSTALSSEISYRISGDTSLSTALASEITNRINGDNSLSTVISSVAAARLSGDTSLSTVIAAVSTSLTSEASTRLSADTSLSTALASEITNRINGDNSLSTVISSVAAARLSGDTSLSTVIAAVSTSLTSETSSRVSGDASLSTSISTLTSRTITINGTANEVEVTGAAQNLGGNITFTVGLPDNVVITGDLTVNGTTTTLNTTELKIEDNIITLNSNFTGNPNTTPIDCGIEVKRGTGPNFSLFLDESADRWAVNVGGSDENLAYVSEITTNSNSLSTALASEITNRINGDNSLSTVISSVAAARLSGDTSLSTVIAAVSTSLTSEASTRLSADTSLSTAITNEVTARISAVASLEEAFIRESAITTIVYPGVTSSITGSDPYTITVTTGVEDVDVDLVYSVTINGLDAKINSVSANTVIFAAGYSLESTDEVILKYVALHA